jgi:hypothetical protein
MPGADELRYKWRHLCCFTKRQLASVQSVDGIEGFEDLSAGDQELVRRMVKGQLIGDTSVMKPSTTVPVSPPKAKKARPEGADADDDGGADGGDASEVPSVVPTTRVYELDERGKQICPYGELCFRVDAVHFVHMSHRAKPSLALPV